RAAIAKIRLEHRTDNQVASTRAAVDELLSRMSRLALRIANCGTEFHLQSEARARLRECIRKLEHGGKWRSRGPSIVQSRKMLARRRRQLYAIDELGALIERGLLGLGHAVAVIGTIHGVLATIVKCDDREGSASAAASGVRAEIREVDQVLAALESAYADR